MTTWYSRIFPDHSKTPIAKLHEDYLSLCLTQGLPRSAAVFSVRDACSSALTWFFSPETSLLAKLFAATPCDKPAPSADMTVCIGDEECSWETHFPWRALSLKSTRQAAAREERRVDRTLLGSLKSELNDAQLIALGSLEKFGWDLKFVRRPMPGRPIPFVFDADRRRFAVLRMDGSLDENARLEIRRHP
jgi:hypothetical protein